MSRLEGKKQLQGRFRALGRTENLLREIQILGVREAKLLVPRKTGNLGRTIRPGDVGRTHASILAGGQRDVGYAAAVEFGSRPHEIRPVRAKILAWPAAGAATRLTGSLRRSEYVKGTNRAKAGKLTFARKVRHPGTRAQPYLGPGLAKAAEDGAGIIVKIWNQAG